MSATDQAADLILEAATKVHDTDPVLRDEIVDFAMSVKGSPVRIDIDITARKKGLLLSELNTKADDNPRTAFVYYRCGILADEMIDMDLTNMAILGCVVSDDEGLLDRAFGLSFEEAR